MHGQRGGDLGWVFVCFFIIDFDGTAIGQGMAGSFSRENDSHREVVSYVQVVVRRIQPGGDRLLRATGNSSGGGVEHGRCCRFSPRPSSLAALRCCVLHSRGQQVRFSCRNLPVDQSTPAPDVFFF